ncbi:MAG: altronate dehydratase [Anaerolineae bacterium]|nr:altronate dehydratase [Anaerolineae bacterium]
MTPSNIDFVETSAPGSIPFDKVALCLHPQDDVAIAKTNLTAGTVLVLPATGQTPTELAISQFIPAGHKIALRRIAAGDTVRRYGQVIGFASQTIEPGQHIHTHNLKLKDFDREYAFGAEVKPVSYVPANERRMFMGYPRANGQVGTRNYLAVISSVNCSAFTTRQIARYFTPERLADYANVDGVIAFTHASGCGGVHSGTLARRILQRTLAGMARHPNVGGYIFVGLGCENLPIADTVEQEHLASPGQPVSLTIQDSGGIRKTVAAGIEAVQELLPLVNAVERAPQPLSGLALALECGGSDSWSGVTANPLVGLVADEVVRQGGTVVLSETSEIFGAEHLLTRRAITPEVGQKILDKIAWWQDYIHRLGVEFDNNPSPGNKAGGLTNIVEKSLGAVAKSGSSPLMAVYDYAEPITSRGFVYMDAPGYDPVSVTGKMAGGCNEVLFTTGRGSVAGFKPAPSLKICSNSATYSRLEDDMDFNAGRVLEDGADMAALAAELLELVVAVASGQSSKSEAQGVGEDEFIPWDPGAVI